MPEIDQLLLEAATLHERGELAAATRGYHHVLQISPNHSVALHHLGIIALNSGRLVEAEQLLRQSIIANPNNAGAYFHLGEVGRAQNQYKPAIDSYGRALQLDPNMAVAYQSLGEVLFASGKVAESVDIFRALIQISPMLAGAHLLLGQSLAALGRNAEAIAPLQQAIALNPNGGAQHQLLGEAELALGHVRPAVTALERAVELEPENPTFHSALARAYRAANSRGQALKHHAKTAELVPTSTVALNNYGVALSEEGQNEKAEMILRRAIEVQPTNVPANTNLANVLLERCLQPQAMEQYRRMMALAEDNSTVGNVYLYAIHFDSEADEKTIVEAHRRWADRHAVILPRARSLETVDRNPDRPLRIGYVSHDFRHHVIGRFLEPILQYHDPQQFELFCYSDVLFPDDTTRRIRSRIKNWRRTPGGTDQMLAELIAQDQIDLLIDVTGHMEGSRLLCFARQPAPVQISHIGYPATVGVPAIGYRITDAHIDPPEFGNGLGVETLLRMPNSFYLYSPQSGAPPAAPPPGERNGFITFGSLNAAAKNSPAAVALWAMVLHRVKGSKFLLATPPDGSANQPLADAFAKHGIDRSRLIFEPKRDLIGYLHLYGQIDIVLDPQPYGGGITSCDGLWMGVPVVTLVGQRNVGRVGASLMRNIGLADLVASTPEQMVEIADALSQDSSRLKKLRTELREMMRRSPIMNEVQYTKDLEVLYRQAWRRFCAGQQ